VKKTILESPRAVINFPPPSSGRRIFLFRGKGAGGPGIPNLIQLLQTHGHLVTTSTIIPSDLSTDLYDILVFPGGTANGQQSSIGPNGAKLVKEFVKQGGGYVGICAGSYLGSIGQKVGLSLIEAKFYVIYSSRKIKNKSVDVKANVKLELKQESILWINGNEIKLNEEKKEEETEKKNMQIDCMYHNGAGWKMESLPKNVKVLAMYKQVDWIEPTETNGGNRLGGSNGGGQQKKKRTKSSY